MVDTHRVPGYGAANGKRIGPSGLIAAAICGQIAFFSGSAATAQVPPQIPTLPGAILPGRDRPDLAFPSQPNFDFRIETPNRSPTPRAVDELRFRLADIRINGAVTIAAERLRTFYQNLIGSEVSLSDILDVAASIENEYRRNGYPLIRAFVPPQRVADGIFTINIVEGFVANVAVEGKGDSTRQRIRGYLQPALDSRPLKMATVEEALLLANDLPGVAATGVLRPSLDTQGASDLVVNLTSAPIRGGLTVDNRGSKFSGIWTFVADVEVSSLVGDDDELQLSVATSSRDAFVGRLATQVRYRRPLGNTRAILSFVGSVTHGEPGSTLRAFNVLTDSWSFGPRVTYPVIRTRAESLSLEAGFTVQDARLSILNVPFSHDQWRSVDIGVSYLQNGFLGATWAATAGIVQGLPIFGATDTTSNDLSRLGAHTDFTKLTGTFRFTHPIDQSPFSVSLSTQGQFSFARLITGEQYAFGGTQIGRGYDPAAITGDDAIGASVELRYDRPVAMSFVQALQPYIFFDTARVWSGRTPALDHTINSTGAGIRYTMSYNIFGGIEVARTLTSVTGSDGGKYATKLLFNLAVRF